MTEPCAPDGKYHVEIRDARGVVIGDNNVVYQHFLDERYQPLAEHLIAFDDLITERTADFVGRAFLDARLAAFMERHDRGYFVLVGEPGIGKTAWAAHVVREHRALHHFNVSALGIIRPDQALENLCAQVIARFQLGQPFLPINAGRDGSLLDKFLRQAAERLDGDKLVIVIDALDEAQMPADVHGTNALYLPSSLPAGVYFVLTRRPQLILLETAPGIPSENFALGADLPANQADVRAHLRQQATRPEIAVRLADRHIPTERFVEELAARSAGNFMYLAYLLPDIAAGLFDPLSLTGLPQGLLGYYERFWNELESAKGEGREAWTKFYKPVIGILAAAREPVSAAWIGHVLDLDPNEVADFALIRWRKYLYRSQNADVDSWQVYHASFQDFLTEKLDDLVSGHCRIVRYCERFLGEGTASLDDYGLRHLPYHYVHADQATELKALLESPFLRRKRERFGLSPVMNDITLAQEAMIKCGELEGLLYLFLLENAIHEREAAGFPPFHLALQALEGDWDGALDRALALINPEQRILALACIAVTCALTGHSGGTELLDRCEDSFRQMSPNDAGRVVARAAKFVAILDYQRAFRWLLRLVPPSGSQSQSVHDDHGLRFTTALLLVQRKAIDLLAEALADLWKLLKDGDGDGDFGGLEPPYDFMPTWLYDAYCQILPWAVETRHIRLLAMLSAAYRSAGEKSLTPFVAALEKLDSAGIVGVTRLLLDSATATPAILQACASLLVRRRPTDWMWFLPVVPSVDWHDALIDQAIRCRATPPETGWDEYLDEISDARMKLGVVQFLLRDLAETLSSESGADLIALAGQLLHSLENASSEAWRTYATIRLTMLERKEARAQALAGFWNELASAGIDCSRHSLFTWFLDTDPSFTVSMLPRLRVASESASMLRSWAENSAQNLAPDVKASLAAWLHCVLSVIRTKEKLRDDHDGAGKDLLHTLAFIDPSAAFQMRSLISSDSRSWFAGDCGTTAAKAGDLDLLGQVTTYMQEIDRKYQDPTNLSAFLRDIYAFQPEFVTETISKLRSSTWKSKCLVHVAQSLLPEDLPGAWRLIGETEVSSFFSGLSVAGYTALKKSRNLRKAETLLSQQSFHFSDPLRSAHKLRDIDLTPVESDLILEHLISKGHHSDRPILLETHRRLSQGTRPLLRLEDTALLSRIDLAYLDLAIAGELDQGLAVLDVDGLYPSTAQDIGDYLFWTALLAGRLDVSRAVTNRWPYMRRNSTKLPYPRSEITLVPVDKYASVRLIQRSAGSDRITLAEAITDLKMLVPDDTEVAIGVTTILRARESPVTPDVVCTLDDAGLLHVDNDETGLLQVLADLTWEGDEVADLFWQRIPPLLITPDLLIRIVTELAAVRSVLLDEVIEHILTHPRLGQMLVDLSARPALDNGTLRRLLEQEMANTESLRVSGQGEWVSRLSYVVNAARNILAADECSRLAERLLQGTPEDYVRRDHVLRYACVLVAADDPIRALQMVEPLLDDLYVSPISEIVRCAPKAVFDYILARERSRQGETIYLMPGNPLFYPFKRALEVLALSAEQLRDLKGQVVMVSTVDSPERVLEGLLVTRLLEDGEIEEAIKYVELECPAVTSILIPALVAAARWDDIKRVLLSVKDSDANLHDDLLCAVIEETAAAQPELALGYLEQIQDPDDKLKALKYFLDSAVQIDYPEQIQDPDDKFKALKYFLGSAVQSGITESKTKEVFDQMLQVAYLVDYISVEQALRETLSSGLEVLPPLEIAAAMVQHKNSAPPTVKEIVCWAERAFPDDGSGQMIVKIRQASDMVAHQLD